MSNIHLSNTSVVFRIAPHLSVSINLICAPGLGFHWWRAWCIAVQARAGPARWLWPVCGQSSVSPCSGAVMVISGHCHNMYISTSQTYDELVTWSVRWAMMPPKDPVLGRYEALGYLRLSPCDGQALLSVSVQARQVSPGQEPLTYIFTFLCLSCLPSSQVLSQKLGDRTQAYSTGPTTWRLKWQWEVNKELEYYIYLGMNGWLYVFLDLEHLFPMRFKLPPGQ